MIKKSVLFLAIILSFVLIKPYISFGEETVDQLTNQINEYTQKLVELGKSKDTLANQIKILNSKIELTLLKINQTENSIKILENEINTLTIKINDLDIYLNQLSILLIQQINQDYKLIKKIPILSLFLTSSLNNYMEQHKYMAVVQKNNQQNLLSMETTRTNFDIQKAEKTKKQQELEVLQESLAKQKVDLANQKESKNNLLEVTKNDEARYQKLKNAAEEELSSLLKAKFVGKRDVKEGEALGLMGNTGYSFGDHLHFGLYNLKESEITSWTYVNDIDPSDFLSKHTWPMNEPIRITQGRGNTKYSYLYADRFHHGIDMVSTNKTVRASFEGVAYFYRNPGSSLGNHVRLFHPDGKMTLYLHLQ